MAAHLRKNQNSHFTSQGVNWTAADQRHSNMVVGLGVGLGLGIPVLLLLLVFCYAHTVAHTRHPYVEKTAAAKEEATRAGADFRAELA